MLTINKQSGHSLIELITVITIISILAFAFVPNLRHTHEHVSDELVSTQLKDAIYFAQLESTIRHQVIGVCQSNGHDCSTVWHGELMVFTDNTGDGVIHDRHQIIRVITLKDDKEILHWRAYPHYRHYLQFSPDRLSANDNGTIWYCRAQAVLPSFALTLSRAGLVTLIKPDRQGKISDGEGKALLC